MVTTDVKHLRRIARTATLAYTVFTAGALTLLCFEVYSVVFGFLVVQTAALLLKAGAITLDIHGDELAQPDD